MPENNPYNQAIAKSLKYINKRYIEHSDNTGTGTVDYNVSGDVQVGDGLSGGANAVVGGAMGVAQYTKGSASKKGGAILGFQEGTQLNPGKLHRSKKTEKNKASTLGLPGDQVANQLEKPDMVSAEYSVGDAIKSESKVEGGSGFASGTFMDTGVGSTLGAVGKGSSGGARKKRTPKVKVEEVVKLVEDAGLKVPEKVKKEAKKVAKKALENPDAILKQAVGIAEPIVKKATKKAKATVSAVAPAISGAVVGKVKAEVPGLVEKASEVVGLGKGDKAFITRVTKKRQAGKELTAKEAERVKLLGAEKKLEGGFINFLIPALAPIVAPLLVKGAIELAKKGKKALTGKGAVETVKALPKVIQEKPVPVAQMQASMMTGGQKGKSARAEIVKQVMKEMNMKLAEASKYVKANNLY